MQGLRGAWGRGASVFALIVVGCNQLIGNDKERTLYAGHADAGSNGDASGGVGNEVGGMSGGGSDSVGRGGTTVVGDAGDSGSAGESGTTANGGGAGNGVIVQPAPCDATEQPSAATGVFVSHDTGSPTGTGSALDPFKTIMSGVQAAGAAGKKLVYVDKGTYAEQLVFTAGEAGVIVRGGFARQGASWVRSCGSRDLTLVQAPTAVAIDVSGTTVTSGVRELTITTHAGASLPDAGGESVYGVRVAGAGVKFSLYDVAVVAGDGGNGGAASPGTTPSVATGTCGTTTACADGTAGTDGSKAQAAPVGTFSVAGYTPGDGDVGKNGGLGHAGVVGAAASMNGCTTCTGCGALHCNCACAQSGCNNSCESGTQGSTQVSSPLGACGCGGPGAIGGKAGRGGGASVALFVSGGAIVSLSYSSLTAGKGGDGSIGGGAAPGASGSDGATATASCAAGSCICNLVGGGAQCGTSAPSVPVASQKGAKGGKGGGSTKGGGGAGGPSYGAVLFGGSTIVPDDQTTLLGTTGGTGADGAPAGTVGTKLIAP